MIGDFRTKDGRCIVAEERLLLKTGERGLLGTLREALTDDGIPPIRRAGVALFAVASVSPRRGSRAPRSDWRWRSAPGRSTAAGAVRRRTWRSRSTTWSTSNRSTGSRC